MSESHLWREAQSLLCGDKIGQGVAREVYECRIDPKLVVKIEGGARSFQNINEFEAWSFMKRKHDRWLAPCKAVSACGTILLQARCYPIRTKELPKRIPKFLTDIKADNFGILDGRVVCFDYGTLIHSVNLSPTILVKAKWR